MDVTVKLEQEGEKKKRRGRPTKHVVDYFPHFARHGRSIAHLKRKYGNDGYAVWFQLLEVLAVTDGYCLDLNDEITRDELAFTCCVLPGRLMEILTTIASMGNVDRELFDNGFIWCQNFVDGLSPAYEKRISMIPERPTLKTLKTISSPGNSISGAGNSINDTIKSISGAGNTQSKVKESKRKKTHTPQTPRTSENPEVEKPQSVCVELVEPPRVPEQKPQVSEACVSVGVCASVCDLVADATEKPEAQKTAHRTHAVHALIRSHSLGGKRLTEAEGIACDHGEDFALWAFTDVLQNGPPWAKTKEPVSDFVAVTIKGLALLKEKWVKKQEANLEAEERAKRLELQRIQTENEEIRKAAADRYWDELHPATQSRFYAAAAASVKDTFPTLLPGIAHETATSNAKAAAFRESQTQNQKPGLRVVGGAQ